ncbi:unnamed protein product [Pleuronectes platessa]|uniref:Immunoglobulin V-set domain-containing protein n=2 Tax=Pleuronectes platessa TaxID=8262 RepID=A0A9N7YDI3_PLEPL|nr:unnamed protein product [Pleuronectes platessa]
MLGLSAQGGGLSGSGAELRRRGLHSVIDSGGGRANSLQRAAMLVLVQFLMMMMMMKSEVASENITVSAQSGDPVLLSSDQLKTRTEDRWDFRWTHLHLMLSLKNNVTTCPHGRCKLLSDGSLSFTTVQPEDAGNYSLEVFDRKGTRRRRTHFLLRVEVKSSHNMWLWICCPLLVLLPLVFIILFVLRKRNQRTTTRNKEENVYMPMHSYHGNTRTFGKQEEGEESPYVPCHPAGSMKTLISQQNSPDAEDVYE